MEDSFKDKKKDKLAQRLRRGGWSESGEAVSFRKKDISYEMGKKEGMLGGKQW